MIQRNGFSYELRGRSHGKAYRNQLDIQNFIKENFVRKDKIKPIQIIDLDGKIHNVYKIEEE